MVPPVCPVVKAKVALPSRSKSKAMSLMLPRVAVVAGSSRLRVSPVVMRPSAVAGSNLQLAVER